MSIKILSKLEKLHHEMLEVVIVSDNDLFRDIKAKMEIIKKLNAIRPEPEKEPEPELEPISTLDAANVAIKLLEGFTEDERRCIVNTVAAFYGIGD